MENSPDKKHSQKGNLKYMENQESWVGALEEEATGDNLE